MKRKLLLFFLLTILFSAMADLMFVKLTAANFNPFVEFFPNQPSKEAPLVIVQSPVMNQSYGSNSIMLNFTVSKPTSWFGSSPEEWLENDPSLNKTYLSAVRVRSYYYLLDNSVSENFTVDDSSLFIDSPFEELNFSIPLNNLTEGAHNLTIFIKSQSYYMDSSAPLSAFPESVEIDASSRVIYFTIDKTLPQVSFLFDSNTTFGINFLLDFKVSEPFSSIVYSLDGSDNITISGNTTLNNLSGGSHNLTIFVWDIAGNVGSESINFEIVPLTFIIIAIVVCFGIIVATAFLVSFHYFKRRTKQKN